MLNLEITMDSSVDQIDIVKKSKIALMALSTRSVILNILQVVSKIVLAKNLLAADFGSFGILQGWIGTLLFFTDIGLGDVLSRKSSGIERNDFSSYFFIRLLLSLIACLVFIVIFPLLKSHYNLNFKFVNYAALIGIFIILDVLAACPMMLMGHKMEFTKIAKIDLSGSIMTYVVQIAFSFYIKGPWAFFIGLFCGKLVFVIMAFLLSDSIPFPKIKSNLLRLNLNKGILFQIATILPALQAILIPFIMSYFLRVESIGLIFWIEGLVGIPLAIIYNYNRVAFISLSKFSHDLDRLRDVISSFLNPMIFGICFIFGLGAVLSKSIILMIFGLKWFNATLYIHLSCISIGLYSLRFLGLSILSATNNPLRRVVNETLGVALTSLILVLFIALYGIDGYFYGSILSWIICLAIMIYSIREFILSSVHRRLLSAVFAMNFSIWLIFKFGLNENKIYISGLIYIFMFCLFSIMTDNTVLYDIKKIFNNLFSKIKKL